MEGVGIVSVGDKLVGDFLCFPAGTAEYDSVYTWVIVGDSFECRIFVFGMYHVVYVSYVFGSFVSASHDYLFRFVHIGVRDLLDFFGHGGRKEQHFTLLGYFGKNCVDAVEETHVEHFVGFVHDYGRNMVELYRATFDQVDEPSRCGDYDVYAFFQCFYLTLDTRTSIYGQYAQSADILRIIGQVAGYLQTKFPCGR